MKPKLLPKMNKKLQGFLPWEVGQKFLQFFVRFLGEVLARQFCFEINWPLVSRKTFEIQGWEFAKCLKSLEQTAPADANPNACSGNLQEKLENVTTYPLSSLSI